MIKSFYGFSGDGLMLELDGKIYAYPIKKFECARELDDQIVEIGLATCRGTVYIQFSAKHRSAGTLVSEICNRF